jgi:hypothetical protein
MSLLADIFKTVMTEPAIAALVVATGISIRSLWSYRTRSPKLFENLMDIDRLGSYKLSPELGISETSWRTCVEFLTHLKKTLPPDESKRLAKVGLFANASETCGAGMCIMNLEYKNPDTDQYLIYMTIEILNKLSPDEIKAFLAHEVGHILLKHGNGIGAVSKTLHAISLLLLRQDSWPVNLSYAGLLWNRGSMIKAHRDYALVFMLSALTLYVTSKLSQEREFAADAESIKLTNNPAALISGLEKYQEPIANNVYSFFLGRLQSFSDTHPTFELRRERLQKLSGEMPLQDTAETEDHQRYSVQ